MRLQVILAVVIAALLRTTSTTTAKLPDNFPRCKIGVDEEKCLKEAIQKALPIMQKGIPSLHFLSTDPMEITHLSIQEGGNRPVNIKLDMYNSKLYGITDVIVDDVKSDLSKRHIDIFISVALLRLDGDYVMNGKFLLFPLQGKGESKMTLGPVKVVLKLDAVPVKKGNDEFWDVNSFAIDITDVKGFTVDFKNLFNGDKLLGESTNKVLNDNWAAFFQELKPAFEQTFAEVFRLVSNVIFSRVPAKDVFLK